MRLFKKNRKNLILRTLSGQQDPQHDVDWDREVHVNFSFCPKLHSWGGLASMANYFLATAAQWDN
jgi:hypothetical protein